MIQVTLSPATRDRAIARLCVINGLISAMEDSRPHDTLPSLYDDLVQERNEIEALLGPISA